MWRKKKAPTSPISSTVPLASGSAGTDPVDRPVERSLIGKSLVFKGEVSGAQDLTVNGQLEGPVSLSGHTVTVGREGRVQVVDESIVASEPSEPLIGRTGHGTGDPGGVTSKS